MGLGTAIRTYLITPPFSALSFFLFWVCGLAVYRFDAKGRWMHAVGRVFSTMLLRTAGIRVETQGLDELSPSGTYVFVANHLSLADTPLMYMVLPTPFRFIAKESLMKVPIIGGHLRRARHISIDREDGRSAVKSLSETAAILDRREASVIVFAEGGRSAGDLRAFKSGAAHVAIKAGVPAVPLAIRGTADVMPKGAWLLRPGRVSVAAGSAIPTAGCSPKDRDGLTDRLHGEVERLLRETGGG